MNAMTTPKRIFRVPVFHSTIFEGLLAGIWRARHAVRSHGYEWRLAWEQEGVRIYERADYGLAWLRASIADYERALYGLMADGVVGVDGFLRRRTKNVTRVPGNGYRWQTCGSNRV